MIDDEKTQETEDEGTPDAVNGEAPAESPEAAEVAAAEDKAPSTDDSESTDNGQSVSKQSSAKDNKSSRKKAPPSGEDDSDEENDEGEVEFTSNDPEPFTDDPMGEAYDLEHGSRLGDHSDPAHLPWQTDVGSAKEFFSAEILYRYDILEEEEQRALDGSYRVEVKGLDDGVWTVYLGEELKVVNTREDADIVISIGQKDFLNLINGNLNPQLAILARKMKVGGDVRRALAFQYVLTPTPE